MGKRARTLRSINIMCVRSLCVNARCVQMTKPRLQGAQSVVSRVMRRVERGADFLCELGVYARDPVVFMRMNTLNSNTNFATLC